MHPALSTRLTDMLGCKYPVIQTAMGWVADAGLVAATGNAGGFGFLAGATIAAELVEKEIEAVKSSCDSPFGMNFHMFQPNAEQLVELVIAHRLRAVSYGRAPAPAVIARLKDAGVLCIPTVGAVKHARKAVQLGADALTVQGCEGGGHTGSVATSILLPQVLDAVDVPVVAAGGFSDGRGLAAAICWGAAGIAMGTRFLMTSDSPVPLETLARYQQCSDPSQVVVSRALDGLPQRMIMNDLLATLEKSGAFRRLWIAFKSALAYRKFTGASIWSLLRSLLSMRGQGDISPAQLLMSANAPMIIQKAMVDGQPDAGVLPSGQIAGLLSDLPSCAELIDGLVQVAAQRFDDLSKQAV